MHDTSSQLSPPEALPVSLGGGGDDFSTGGDFSTCLGRVGGGGATPADDVGGGALCVVGGGFARLGSAGVSTADLGSLPAVFASPSGALTSAGGGVGVVGPGAATFASDDGGSAALVSVLSAAATTV